ncbi:hypothetical protein ACFLT0_00240, partial [Chloroflexota bacterium]
SAIEYFKDLPEKIDALEKEWKDILKLRDKERELAAFINAERSQPNNLLQLQTEAKRFREQAKYADELKQECTELSKTIRKSPSLEERKKQLNARIMDYNARVRQAQAQEQDIAAREQQLAKWITRLQERTGWVELAELQQSVREARKELDQVSKQLGEKRSLLDRILGRNKEGSL